MSELEQLRKEVDELRERIAKLEALSPRVVGPMVAAPATNVLPVHVLPVKSQDTWPPGTIIC